MINFSINPYSYSLKGEYGRFQRIKALEDSIASKKKYIVEAEKLLEQLKDVECDLRGVLSYDLVFWNVEEVKDV